MLPKKDSHDKKVMCFDDVSWRSLLQYLNTKFPLEYVYSGNHSLQLNNAGTQEDGSAIQNPGRQSTEVLFFCLFFFPFLFLSGLVLPEAK